MLPRVAWSLFAVTVLLVALDIVVTAQAFPLMSKTAVAVHGFPFVDGACLGCSLMGALIVSRYQRHPVGWLLSAVGVVTSVSLLAEAQAFWVLEGDGPGSRALGGTCAWLAELFGGRIIIALLALMFLLVPDGRFLSRRWRYAAVVPATGAALCIGAIVSVDPTGFDLINAEDRYGPARVAVLGVGFGLVNLGLVLGLVSMVRRLRASTGEERQQLRLIALSAGLAAVGLVMLAVGQEANDGEQTWISGVPLFVSFFLMPILFAVAVLRYRLYDLDVIINRTVFVAAGAAFAAVGYTTLVVVAGQLVEGRTGGFWVSLLATVVVALAFQPLRRVVVRLANRVAYGARAQPYEALAEFSRRLAEAPGPDDLLPAVAEAAARAVSARGAKATLDLPGGPPISGTWGWWAADHEEDPDHVVAVRTEGRELGRIAVALPRGHHLRPTDLLLLEALAGQTAVAFRNTSLAGALADRVAELDHTTRKLSESRRRLIAADDAARRALEAAIAREVQPFLQCLPAEIERARACVAGNTDPELDRLVEGTNEALEALRDITRGVFPTQLARSGLDPTLRWLLSRSAVPARFTAAGMAGRRFAPRVEAAIFFCCAEAVRDGTGPVSVDLNAEGNDLVLRIGGVSGDLDRVAVTDRVEAVGGELRIGDGLLVLTIPVAADPGESASAQVGGSTSVVPGS